MKVVVIGAGMAGLSAAHFLRAAGADVTILERRDGPGLETSFANGSVLHPSLAEPWNSPGIFGELMRNLGREDSAMLLRLHQLPNLLGWGVGFIRNSFPERFRRNATNATLLARYSLQVLRELRERIPLQYDAYCKGVLLLFRDAARLEKTVNWARSFESIGMRHNKLTTADVVAMEPSLVAIAAQLVGGIHYPDEEGGDPYAYCCAMARHLESQGVVFEYACDVTAWKRENGRILSVVDANGAEHRGDRFLLAAASYSTPLAAKVGIRIPVRPAKGYSVTLPRGASGYAPNVPVVDNDLHMAVVPVGKDIIRVAGTAEFTGYDISVNAVRIANLMRLLSKLYPQYAAALRPQDVKPWTGLRPMCNEGVPLVGPTVIPNLYLNTGHGQLGWTMAAGSGKLAADLLLGQAPELDPAPYLPTRFN